MPTKRAIYDDVVDVTSVNNGLTVEAEILDYRPGRVLEASINRQVKVKLNWNAKRGLYAGHVGSLEFESKGPKEL